MHMFERCADRSEKLQLVSYNSVMKLPTLDEANQLHKKHAPNEKALNSVWKHSHIVRRIALQIADNWHQTDRELINIGALLHDIGVYKLYKNGELDASKNYVTHGLLGYNLLKEEGFDETICRFALCHTGVGITSQEVESQNLPLPIRDYVAETDEERIVMYADKFHSKTEPPMFNSAEWYRNSLQSKFGEPKAMLFDEFVQEFGEPNLEPLMARYGHGLR